MDVGGPWGRRNRHGVRHSRRVAQRQSVAITRQRSEVRILPAPTFPTEKDRVRLQAWLPFEPPLATVPLTLGVEPADEFQAFLADRLAAERTSVA